MTELTWAELDARPVPPWFQRAKFGIFVHWGVFSVPAWRTVSDELFGGYAEWYYASVYGDYRSADPGYHADTWGEGFAYRDFGPLLTAERFDPQDWAALFRRAGARYVVLTSKHHDGYCMWPTENPHKVGWNVSDTGAHRDLLGDLTDAVRASGLRMGLYYSMPEWETHPSHRCDGGYFIPTGDVERYGIDPARYPEEILHPQWRELNERYQPSVIYTDGGEWDLDEDQIGTRKLLTWLYTEAPNRDEVVVNDRMSVGMPGRHGDYYSTEYSDVEAYGDAHPWEESRGIGKSYGYNRAETLDDYADAGELLDLLVDTVGRGGNLLLNVGPKDDGTIPDVQRQRLEEIGAWLKPNGAAIYDTEALHLNLPDGAYAVGRGDERFLLATRRVEDTLDVPRDVCGATDVATGEPLTVHGRSITLPPGRVAPMAIRLTSESGAQS